MDPCHSLPKQSSQIGQAPDSAKDSVSTKIRQSLSQCPIAVKRQHGHSNSYKKKAFDWGWLTVQRSRLLSSWREAWHHAGRHGAGERAESSTFQSTGSSERERLGLA